MEMIIGFLTTNWMNIMVIAMFVCLAICLYKKGYKNKVYMMLLMIVDEIEFKYKDESKEVKYAVILDRIYHHLPSAVRWLISINELDRMIITAIDDIQAMLGNEKDKLE